MVRLGSPSPMISNKQTYGKFRTSQYSRFGNPGAFCTTSGTTDLFLLLGSAQGLDGGLAVGAAGAQALRLGLLRWSGSDDPVDDKGGSDVR